MTNHVKTMNDMFKAAYGDKMEELYNDFVKPALTLEDWLKRDISEQDIEKYPHAKKAAQLKNSKLYKALK